jgi:hypothetical protein
MWRCSGAAPVSAESKMLFRNGSRVFPFLNLKRSLDWSLPHTAVGDGNPRCVNLILALMDAEETLFFNCALPCTVAAAVRERLLQRRSPIWFVLMNPAR